MGFIKLIFSLLLLLVAIVCWPVTLVILIFWGLMKVGMDKDFEP